MTNDNHLRSETYQGHAIALILEPAINDRGYSRPAMVTIQLDGKSYQGWSRVASLVTVDEAWKALAPKARKAVDLAAEDTRLAPRLIELATSDAGPIEGKTIANVGDVVRLYSRGTTRLGVATKVTKTGTVTVAYTTPGAIADMQRYGGSTPTITRKAAKAGEYDALVEGCAPSPGGRHSAG